MSLLIFGAGKYRLFKDMNQSFRAKWDALQRSQCLGKKLEGRKEAAWWDSSRPGLQQARCRPRLSLCWAPSCHPQHTFQQALFSPFFLFDASSVYVRIVIVILSTHRRKEILPFVHQQYMIYEKAQSSFSCGWNQKQR